MNQKPRIAILGGGLNMAAAAALIASAGHKVDLVQLDESHSLKMPDFDLFPAPAPEPPRYIHNEPIILGGGVKSPRWPADPIKQAARKRQRAARRKNR